MMHVTNMKTQFAPQKVPIIKLPQTQNYDAYCEEYESKNLTALAWETEVINKNIFKKIKKLPMKAISNAKCSTDYPISIYDSNICTIPNMKNGSRVCAGDSGSPLIMESFTNDMKLNQTLIGIASYTREGECGIEAPSVYQKVISHLCWIQKQIENFGKNLTCPEETYNTKKLVYGRAVPLVLPFTSILCSFELDFLKT